MRFNHPVPLGLALTAIIASGSAAAQATPSASLVVEGTYVPTACEPSLTTSSVDFGTIGTRSLNPDTATSLGERTVTLNVRCDTVGPFAIRVIDDRAGTAVAGTAAVGRPGATDASAFGLGATTGDTPTNIGGYTINLVSVVADGQAKFFTRSFDEGVTWQDSTVGTQLTVTPQMGLYSWRIDPTARPGGGYVSNAVSLSVRAAVAAANDLDLSDEVSLNGQATIEMFYL